MQIADLLDAFSTGGGVTWGEQDPDVVTGSERSYRPGYAANLVSSWIPALLGGALLVTGEVPRTTAFETGWLAHHALYEAMPQAYRPNSVGSRLELLAAPETNVA